MDVGHLGRGRAQRIHGDPKRARIPGTLDPAKGERLTCGNIGTQSEQAARVRDIAPEPVGLGDAEGRGDTGCEGAPTESRFGVDVHHAPGSQRLGEQELLLSHKARAAEAADGPSAHDRHAAGTLPGAVVVVAVAIVAVAAAVAPVPFVEVRLALRLIVGLHALDALFEGGIPRVLHQGGDLIQCSIPGDVFPRIRPSTTHPRRGQAPRTSRRRAPPPPARPPPRAPVCRRPDTPRRRRPAPQGPQALRPAPRRCRRALRRPLRRPRLDSDPNPMPRFPPPRLRHQPESLSASISWTNVSFAQARVLLAQAYSHPVS